MIRYQKSGSASVCRQARKAKLWAMGLDSSGPAPEHKASLTRHHGKLRHYQKSKGFTLLEVLVALAIVAVAAAGIMVLGNDLFRLMGDARDRDSLALLAREVVYRHGKDLRHPARREGECDAPDEDCRWLIVTESTGELGMVLVRVTVDCGRERSVTIERAIAASVGSP